MKANEPENFEKINKLMLPKDYIAYKLPAYTARIIRIKAGMLLLDVRNRQWSKEMLDICGISEKVMPKLLKATKRSEKFFRKRRRN